MTDEIMDLGSFRPGKPISVKVGGKTYEMPLDQPSVLRAKMLRWLGNLADPAADEEAMEVESLQYVAHALRVDEAEVATWLPIEKEAVIRFLAAGDLRLITSRPVSLSESSMSSVPSVEASHMAT